MHPRKTYVLFMACCGAGFGAACTTYVPALLERGLTLADVAAVNIFFWLTISVMEVPTGMLADGKSRMWSLRAGSAIYAIGEFGYATAWSFASAAFWECFIGVAFAFLSGAQQAWATDALIRRGEQERIRETFAAAAFAKQSMVIISGMLGGFLGTIDLRLGWVLSGVCHLAALCVALTWMKEEGEPLKRMTERQAFAASLAVTRKTPSLRWAMLLAALFGLVLPFNHYWTPFFRERVGQHGIAMLWVPFGLAMALGSVAVRRKGFLTGLDGIGLAISHIFTGVGLAIAGMAGGVAVPVIAVIVHEFGRGMFEPLMDTYVQRRIESGYRATYGSFQSLVQRGGYGLILLAVWFSTRDMPSNGHTISIIWSVCGVILLLATLVAWRFRPRQGTGAAPDQKP